MNGLTKEDLENNRDAVRATIAEVLGICPEDVNLDDVEVSKGGSICVNLQTPSSVAIPEGIAELATPRLNEIPGLPTVEATTSNLLSQE